MTSQSIFAYYYGSQISENEEAFFQNTMIILFVVPPKALFSVSLGGWGGGGLPLVSREIEKNILKQNFGGTAKSIMVVL